MLSLYSTVAAELTVPRVTDIATEYLRRVSTKSEAGHPSMTQRRKN